MQIVAVVSNRLKAVYTCILLYPIFVGIYWIELRPGCSCKRLFSFLMTMTVLHTIVRLNPEGVEEKGTRYA